MSLYFYIDVSLMCNVWQLVYISLGLDLGIGNHDGLDMLCACNVYVMFSRVFILKNHMEHVQHSRW